MFTIENEHHIQAAEDRLRDQIDEERILDRLLRTVFSFPKEVLLGVFSDLKEKAESTLALLIQRVRD